MEIAAGGGDDQQAIAVDEFRKNADRIVKPPFPAHIAIDQIVNRIDLARIANAQCHAEIAQFGVFATGHEPAQGGNRRHRLRPPFDLTAGQIIGIGAIAGHVHKVEVGQIALIADSAPGPGNGLQTVGQYPGAVRSLERFAQERRKQRVFLARSGHRPFAVLGPVGISLRVGLDRGDEPGLVDARHRKHHRHAHHLFARGFEHRCARLCRDVGVAGGIDHAPGQDRLAPGFAFSDNATNFPVLHDGRNKHTVQHRVDIGLGHQHIGNIFERFGIERVADRLRLGQGRAHCLGAVFKFAADALAVDRCGVAIPGKAFDPDLRDIAAKTAIAFDQRGLRPGAGRSERSGKATRARSHHQHIGFVDDIDLPGGFGYGLGHGRIAATDQDGTPLSSAPYRKKAKWCGAPCPDGMVRA